MQDPVTVVGYPIGGDTISVTSGVVSRIEVTDYDHGSHLLGIQIDAAINFGNSGADVTCLCQDQSHTELASSSSSSICLAACQQHTIILSISLGSWHCSTALRPQMHEAAVRSDHCASCLDLIPSTQEGLSSTRQATAWALPLPDLWRQRLWDMPSRLLS